MKRLLVWVLAWLSGCAAGWGQLQKAMLPLGPAGQEMTAYFYFFDERRHELVVLDQGGKPFQKYRNLDHAMRAGQCVAGCNGGFFHPDGRPIGGVTSGGAVAEKAGNAGGSSLASGVVHVTAGRLAMERTAAWLARAGRGKPTELVQGGPFLVEGGKVVAGLSGRKFARRTVLLTDGRGRWALMQAPATSLAILARALARPGAVPGFRVEAALNFDGGPSSGFWVERGGNNPFYLREVSKVRNFLGVRRKKAGGAR